MQILRSDDLLKEHRWAIITFDTHYTPGDERSRTNPGHGYPESHDPYVILRAFTDQDAWENEISRLTKARKTFKAFTMQHASVSTTVNVQVTP